jgi:hypothetical protein
VDVSYFHPAVNHRLSEVIEVDLRDYLGTWPAELPTHELEETIKKGLGEVRDQVKRVADTLTEIASISRPSGLQVSVHTLESLVSSFGREPNAPKLDPHGQTPAVFADILGIDTRIAYSVYRHFRDRKSTNLEEIAGLTPDVIERFKTYFNTTAVVADCADTRGSSDRQPPNER